MNLKDLKIDLPENWRVISRAGGEDQLLLKIYHISPLSKVDSKITQDQFFSQPGSNTNITKVGVPVANRQPLKDFYKGMKGAISSGYMSPQWTQSKLDNLYKKMTDGCYPEDGDFSADISIIRYPNEETAKQSFKNIALMPTQRFNVPVPGGVDIPGLPKDATFLKLFESGAYESYMPEYMEKIKEQLPKDQQGQAEEQIKKFRENLSKEKMEKAREMMSEAQKQISEKIRPDFEKSGVKYKEGKYLGCDVIYMEGKNPSPPPKPKISSHQKPAGVWGGGGFDDRLEPLPKFSKPYKATTIIYQALLIKNFVITGDLLWQIDSLPPGNTPCYSLTKSKRKVSTSRGERGELLTNISIVPEVSNYAKEGYLHKEEVEKILKNIIARLK